MQLITYYWRWSCGHWEAAPALCDAVHLTGKLVVVTDGHGVVVGRHAKQGVRVHSTLSGNSHCNDPDALTFDAVCLVG